MASYCRRKQEELISDLRQEKIYLEYKIDSLEKELREVKDGTHHQRIRALDLKQDLREVRVSLVQDDLQLIEILLNINFQYLTSIFCNF